MLLICLVFQIQKAKLTYPVGLLTGEEADMFSGSFEISEDFHLMTPAGIYADQNGSHASNLYFDARGDVNIDVSGSGKGLRPVISLKVGTTYVSGDGSTDRPYVVETN